MRGVIARYDHALAPSRRILFLVSAHNSLSQRALIALTELGHRVEVGLALDDQEAMEAAVAERQGLELIVCPMLKRRVPDRLGDTLAPDRPPGPAQRGSVTKRSIGRSGSARSANGA